MMPQRSGTGRERPPCCLKRPAVSPAMAGWWVTSHPFGHPCQPHFQRGADATLTFHALAPAFCHEGQDTTVIGSMKALKGPRTHTRFWPVKRRPNAQGVRIGFALDLSSAEAGAKLTRD